MAAKIRQNDEVIVITGKSKGQTGTVTKVLTKENKVIVSGVNKVKKHTKPNPSAGVEGGIIEMEAPIHVSNVAILNQSSNRADKIGFRFENGKKVRFFKSTNEIVPNNKA